MPRTPRLAPPRVPLGVALLLLATAACRDGGVPPEGAFLGDLGDFSGLSAAPRAGASEAFWAHWGDGRAELSGYRVSVPRYGELREGEMTLIYVTEPHDRRSWIKDDAIGRPHRVEVLKLIRSVQFLTGVYPYSILGSAFAPVEPWGGERFQPVRLQLDVQEWCGSVVHRVWPGPDRLRSLRLSYFAGEGETLVEQEVPPGTLYEDALLIQLRELDGPFHGGRDWEGWIVPELWSLRATRGPVEAVPGRITRTEGVREGVPVTHFLLETDGFWRRFDIEIAPPRRILGWEGSDGARAELTGTERLAYWNLNGVGDEGHRDALGLDPLGRLPATGGGACTVNPDGTAAP